jgi:hypothetical protein
MKGDKIMQPSNARPWAAAVAAALTLAQLGIAADHGPVFGLAKERYRFALNFAYFF